MTKQYDSLIENIKQCDLNETDKQTLIEILSQPNVDINQFLIALFNILKLTSTISKLFDIDIGAD